MRELLLKNRRPRFSRQASERVLIVCEGEKTEPLYFDAIKRELHLSPAYINCIPSCLGTNPLNVVHSANDEFQKDNAWDRVYCVFDRDEHPHFKEALEYAKAKNGTLQNDKGLNVAFVSIVSNPCFELWLLLHYKTVRKSIERGKATTELKRYIKKYTKGYEHSYEDTRDKLEKAYANEELISSNIDELGTTVSNPYTNVGALVKFLLNDMHPTGLIRG